VTVVVHVAAQLSDSQVARGSSAVVQLDTISSDSHPVALFAS
jgi:hypothetical protein